MSNSPETQAPLTGDDPGPTSSASSFQLRPFRNTDPPALVDLWNRGLPDRNVIRPLSVYDWDAMVAGKPHFEAAGLIVAERDGRPIGFAHAGFGPLEEDGPSHRLDIAMGTVAMLVIDPEVDSAVLENDLLIAAERYLRRRGASVIYAGGRHPLDPFYWGLYGGSEFSGILGGHQAFHRAVRRRGYQAVSTAILLEFDLANAEPREPRLALLKRQVRMEIIEDHPPLGWWTATAIGSFRPTLFRMVAKADDRPIASVLTWEVAAELVGSGPNRTGLVIMEVAPEFRRRGYGRLLVAEVLRHSREMLADLVEVQTIDTNAPALQLYEGAGFQRVETATLYRLPADRVDELPSSKNSLPEGPAIS